MARPRLGGQWRGNGRGGDRGRSCRRCKRRRRRLRRRRVGGVAWCGRRSRLGCGRCRRCGCWCRRGDRRGAGSRRRGRRPQAGPNRGGRQGQLRLRWAQRQAGRRPWRPRPWRRGRAAASDARGRWRFSRRWLAAGGNGFFRDRRFRRSDGGAKAGSIWGGRHRLACVCPIFHGLSPFGGDAMCCVGRRAKRRRAHQVSPFGTVAPATYGESTPFSQRRVQASHPCRTLPCGGDAFASNAACRRGWSSSCSPSPQAMSLSLRQCEVVRPAPRRGKGARLGPARAQAAVAATAGKSVGDRWHGAADVRQRCGARL